MRDGIDKVPTPVRKLLQYVPQIFALYSDGFVEQLSAPPTSPAGIKELERWATRGPPRYASSPPASAAITDDEEDAIANPTLEVVVVTSTTCHHCKAWEESGGLQRFLDSVPPGFEKSHFNVNPQSVPQDAGEMSRRNSIVGVAVPSVIVVNHAKWTSPAATSLSPRDVLISPADVRSPDGLVLFNRWLKLMTDKRVPFLGYMVLRTSDTCGHCRAWKLSGGVEQFMKANGNLDGILLSHNGFLPQVIESTIRSVPSVIFVPALEWSSPNPEIIPGPDPRNPNSMTTWVSELQSTEGRWKNDPNYVPGEYSRAAATHASLAAAGSSSSRGGRQLKRRIVR